MCLMDPPEPMSSEARKSSNPGCDGGELRVPKSLGVVTSPAPKWCIQIRFTMTRAVSGFEGSTMDSARARRPLPCLNGVL